MSLSYKEKYSDHLRELPTVRAELVVRPDLIRVSFTVSLETGSADATLPQLQRACEQLHRRVREALPTEVTFRPRDARFNRSEPKKLPLPEDDATFVAVAGTFEAPLPPELDFWARSARVASLVRVCHEAESDSRQSKKLPRLSFGSVDAVVAKPEAHRAELLQRFVARVREMAAAVGSPEAPLHVVDCSAPGAVEQNPVSLEEVGLSLNVHCRLDVVRGPGALDGGRSAR